MNLPDILAADCIRVDLKGKTRKAVVVELIDLLVKSGKVKDKDKAVQAVMDREKLMSTGIGNGIAIPHAKTNFVDSLCLAFGRSAGVGFDALDEKPVRLVFLLLTPESDTGGHITALARISRLLKHKVFKDALLAAKNAKEVYKIIEDEERGRT